MKLANFNVEPQRDMTDQPLFEGGHVYGQMQSLLKDTKDLMVGIITFTPGAMTKIHFHDHEQVIYCISGRGRALTDKGEEVELQPGMMCFFPPFERHAHGAPEGATFVQMSITNGAKSEKKYEM